VRPVCVLGEVQPASGNMLSGTSCSRTYLVGMHTRIVVPFIGLHLNAIGLPFACGIVFTVLITVLCLVRPSRLAGIVATALIILVDGGIFLFTPLAEASPYSGFGEEAAEYLGVAHLFICIMALLAISSIFIDPGFGWGGGSGDDDSPDDGRGPRPRGNGIDWGAFDRARAGWSRSRDRTPAA